MAASILAALLRLMPIVCLSALPAAGLAIGGCGGGGGAASGAGDTVGKASRTIHSSASAQRQVAKRGSGCRSVDAPQAREETGLSRPTLRLDPARRYVATLATNCGSIAIELDVSQAPRTTASFAYLVRRRFYDDLTFHRVAAGFVIQGGDPEGDGSGGPGYQVIEPPPVGVRYTLGTVAMAKTGTDPAGASGSQFFIVTAPDAGLPPEYALVGHVVGGLATVKAISRMPTDPPDDGAPSAPVVIADASLAVS